MKARSSGSRSLTLLAPALVLLTACQGAGGLAFDPQAATRPAIALQYSPPRPAQPPILGVEQASKHGEVYLKFAPGTSFASASTIGHQYALELIEGPFVSGPLSGGRFLYKSPEILIEPITPTTARVYFPNYVTAPDRRSFLASNHLRFEHWMRPDDGVVIALVKLPPSDLKAQLIDPILGRFRIQLPMGLEQDAVRQWASRAGLGLISYRPDTGVAIVHPKNWIAPVVRPIRVYAAPRTASTRPVPPAPTVLYVQFAASLSSQDISSIAQGLGLAVTNVTPTNLAVFVVDPARLRADVQLLSDMASVQCVSRSPNPCGQIVSSAQPAASSPRIGPFGQTSTLVAEVKDGVLELDWSAATGATAYAVFQGQAPTGPLSLVATVAGPQTSLQLFNLISPGASAYFQVIALHPCERPSDSTACDGLNPVYSARLGPSTTWTNPAPPPASATPAPAPQPPMQTRAGSSPLAAPAGLTAAASDGHVDLSWQAVAGASSYRLYRSVAGGPALYVARTSASSLTDVGGTPGLSYGYAVAAVAPDGLLGLSSGAVVVTWAAPTAPPTVMRSLPAEAGFLAGRVRFEIDAQSGTGQGTVQWRVSGPAAAVAIGSAPGQPSGQAAMSWSAALIWDTTSVPDGTYTVTATVIDAAGPQISTISRYRIQNGSGAGPTRLSATVQAGGVALTWEQPANESAASYQLFKDTRLSGTPLAEFSADRRTYLDTKATAGQHVYQLVLVDSAGQRSVPATATITLQAVSRAASPNPPDLKLWLPNGQPLAAGGRATDRLLVTAPALNGLKFQLSTDGATWADVGQQPRCGDVCAVDLDLGSLTPGPYLIRASAAGQVSNSRSFVRASAVRYAPPTGLTATAEASGVSLSWTAPASAIPASYVVERRSPHGSWQPLERVVSTGYIDGSAPPPGSDLAYRVAAVDLDGTVGQTSDEITVVLPDAARAEQQAISPPDTPSGLVVYSSEGRAGLRWEPVGGSSGYAVERQSEAQGLFALVGTAGSTTFTDASVLSAGQYTYRVRALNGPVAGAASIEVSALVMPGTAPGPIAGAAAPAASAPPVPTKLTASVRNGELQMSWSAPSGTPPSTTYNVYRMDPSSGVFTLAAAKLETPSFTDTALTAGASYGYAVTASSSAGYESRFSSPSWVYLPPAADTLKVELVAPAPAEATFVQSPNLLALAQVSAAAGTAGVSFAITGGGGTWRFPAVPLNPRSPALPVPVTAGGATALWGGYFNTASLAPGRYQLSVSVRDRAGRSQEQVDDLTVAGADARGPPPAALTALAQPDGVHLGWTSAGTSFTILRSLFGPDGPFEPLATTRSLAYHDPTAIPGVTYSYRVVDQTGIALGGAAVTATPASQSASASLAGGPSVALGDVSQSELRLQVSAVADAPGPNPGIRPLGSAYDVNAISLATGQPVHHLGETAQVSFQLPPGIPAADAATASVYHWDATTAAWIQEASSADPSGTEITATVDRLSPFELGVAVQPAAGSSASQPPPPVSDLSGNATPAPGLKLTPAPAPLQVAADGEVVSLRTAHSRVYKNSDGTLRQTISGDLLNYRDATGAWQKIDTTLVPVSGSGYVTNAAGPLQIQLPADLGSAPVRVGSTTFSIEGARSLSRTVAGSAASYAGILRGVDAGYTVMPSGLRENLVLAHRLAQAPVFTFDLTTGDVVLEQLPDGAVRGVDSSGRTQFTINAPWMHDAPNQQSALGNTSSDIAVTLTGGGGSYRLTYTPDAAWLADPSRLYPVTIDPSFTVNDQYDVQISAYSPNFNYAGYTYDPVGYTYYSNPCCGSGASRAMIQFASSSFLYDGVYASSATLSVYVYTDYDCSRSWEPNGTTFHASAAQGSWGYTTVKWSNQPGPTDSYGTGAATTQRCNYNYWLGMDATGLVRSWETRAFPNYGFVIHADGEFGSANNSENFYSAASGTAPQLTINYTTYAYATSVFQYTGAGNLVNPTTVPNGGTTQVEVVLQNIGSATWLTDTRLTYRWWEGGVAITNYADHPAQYVPYSVPGSSAIILRFGLVAPARLDSGPVYLQFALANNTFAFSSLSYGSPSYACDQFYYTSVSCTTGTPITLADESATITGPNVPALITASASALVSIPVTVQNTVPSAKWASWSSTNAQNTVLIGSRDFRTQQGGVTPLANLRTFLAQDVSAGNSLSINVLLQMPADPGDYKIRIDLVHQAGATLTWFADKGNIPLEVPVRILAAGDDKTTLVSAPLNDGTSLGTNSTNGQAVLAATDLTVPELGATTLHLARTYNGANSSALNNGTGATSLTYGAGWTFDFMRTLRLGVLGPDTYSSIQGLYTDAQGRSWTVTWNPGRGLWEIPAANITVSASTATVVSTNAGSVTVPAMAPVDTVSRGATMLVADAGAPRAWALALDNPQQPDALIIPASQVPSQQNGTIELKVKLDFASTDTGTHTLFADTTGRFKLTWSGNALTFTTGDANGSSTSVSLTNLGWTNNGTWHHVGVLWNEAGAIQLVADSLASTLSTTRVGQSPTGDFYFGYDPSAAAPNPWKGWVAEIRIEGHVVAVNTIKADTGVLVADAYTLYLGAFDPPHGLNSAAGTYRLTNPDQSIEEYNALGQLIDEQDRVGNKITYAWDSSGRITTISDATIAGRTITVTYGTNQFTATDFSGRSVTYGLNANGDLVSVVRSNQVPNPLTGTFTSVPATTTYAYLPGHVLSQIVDPRGGRTTLTYDQSYKSIVLADGPAAYWRLGETAGPTAADSAGTYTATWHGGITPAQFGALWNDPGTAYKFDGSTGYLSASMPTLAGGAPFSIEVWAKFTLGTANQTAVSFAQGAGTAWLGITSTNQPYFQVGTAVSYAGIAGPTATTNAWHHLVGTYDGTNARLYVDGGLVAGPTAIASGAGGSSIYIGNQTGSSQFANATLDEVALYPVALAASDEQAHFLAGRLGAPTPPGAYAANVALDDPVGWWRLGESSGTLAGDQSGYGHQGTYSGGVTLGQPGAISGDTATSAGFDGVTGSMTVPSSPTGSTSMTVEAWFYKTNQNAEPIVEWDNSASVLGVHLWNYPTWDSVFVNFMDTAGAGHSFYSAPGAITKNTWYHLVAVYDASTGIGYLYLNGVRVASATLGSFTPQTSYPLHVATRPGYFFGGSIEDVAAYPFAMSSARILAHYQSGVGRAPMSTELGPPSYAPTVLADNPSGYWRLGETSGTAALDQVTGTFDGVYTGGYTLGRVGAVAGDTDTALGLNGTTAYVGIPAYNLTTFSAEVWWDGTPGGNGWSGPMQLRQAGVNGFQFVNNAASTTTFTPHLTIWNGTSEVAQFAAGVSYPMPFGDMKAFVWTYDGSNARLFVNGVEVPVSTSAVAGFATSCTCVGLGYSAVGGRVDEAAVYNYVLSPARILAHFQSARPAVVVSRGSQPVSYTGAVAADNPIGYYRLDEVGGATAYDRSGLANVGTYSGTLLYGQPGALATDSDPAAQFDGSTGTVALNLNQIDLAAGHQVTVELWMFYVALTAVEMPFGFNGYALQLVPGVGFGFGTGGNAVYGVPISAVPQNRWLHVVAVVKNGSFAGNQLFINGVQQTLSTLPSGTPTSGSVTKLANISGWAANASYKFNGLIDDVSVYNGALSPARVLAHYRAGRTVPSSAASYSYAVTTDVPIGYWRLSDASGPTAAAVVGPGGTYSGTEFFGEPSEFPADTNTSVRFDGATGTVALSGLPVATATGQQTTVELWLYWLGGITVQMPFGFSQYGLLLDPAKGFGFTTNTGGTSPDLYGVDISAVPANTWLLVDAVFTNSGMTSNKLYINGVAQTLSQLRGAPASRAVTATANISGWSFDANYKFNGIIADVSIYNRALSASRILAHYGNGLGIDFRKVNAMIDARGNAVATFFYNADLTQTRVQDARGLNSYYTFQSYGGRTLSITDTGGNVTKFVYDGTNAYSLIATVSPSGIQDARIANSSGVVGQREQTLLTDRSAHPGPSTQVYMDGSTPVGSTLLTTNETWAWDASLEVNPGRPSHVSNPAGGFHEHYLQGAPGIVIPSGSTVVQWVYIEPGVDAPDEVILQFLADGSSWSHRAHWGFGLYDFGCGGVATCDQGVGPLPPSGAWVQLSASLDDVGMNGHAMTGIAFSLLGGSGTVWWGPTLLQLPGGSITDPTSAISTSDYDQFNDLTVSVGPNRIANISDVNNLGQVRHLAGGVEPLAGHALNNTAVASGSDGCTTTGVTCTTLTETHTSRGLQSDIWQEFGPFLAGTRLVVSTNVSTSATGIGPGGAVLVVQNSPTYTANAGGQRSAPVQTAGASKTITVPFVVDESRYVRVLLWQENFTGSTTWTAPVLTDVDPAPDMTLEASTTVYGTDFEDQKDRDAWQPTTGLLKDATNAHGGQYSAHESLSTSNGDAHFYRSFTVVASSDYQLSAWVRTLQSGSQGTPGPTPGASFVITTAETGGTNVATSSVAQTEGRWQLLSFIFNSGANTSINIRLDLANFAGDAYFDDLSLVNLSDTAGVTNWIATSTLTGVVVHNLATGGLAGGGSRQVSMPASTAVNQVQDALQTAPLRNGATYVISVWASSTLATGSITFELTDINKNPITTSNTCAITNVLTLCQNYATWSGNDGSGYLVLMYGGSTTARTITIAHPLVALSTQRRDFTAKGQLAKTYDVFGRATTNTYDTNNLYLTQTVVTATPSPNLTTKFTFNTVGQMVLSTRVNGSATIAEQIWLDSWGRVVGDVKNCVTAIAPPKKCSATATAAVNVLTRNAYDLNGNLTDTYTQGTATGTWVDTHTDYDADGNTIDTIANYVAGQPETATQNVTTRSTYDAISQMTDVTTPAATAGGSTVTHTVFDAAGRPAVSIANYVVGGGSDSDTNVTTTTVYDADGRVTTVWAPASATGEIPTVTTYDVLGRTIRQVTGSNNPPAGFAPAVAQTDWTLDAGGRITDVFGPGTGSPAVRYTTHYDLDALGRKLSVTQAFNCTGNCTSARTRYVYDPRGAKVVYSPPTLQLSGGLATRTVYDLAGQVTNTIEDWQAGAGTAPDLNVTTSIAYDGYGRAISQTDPLGIVTQTVYDGLDRVSSVTLDPTVLKLTTTYTYSLAGDRVQVISPRNGTNRTDQTVYDALHRPVTAYANCVNCLTTGTHDYQTNVESDMTYDALGKVLTTTDALRRVDSFTYDALGRTSSQTISGLTTQWLYDSHGDVISEISPRQCTSSAPCYQGNNGSVIIDGANLTTGYTYDALFRLSGVVEDQGHLQHTTTYTYDPAGNLLSQTDGLGSGHTTSYGIDSLGRTTSMTDASGNTVQTNYNAAGEIISTVNARGQTNTNTLDRLGRVVGVSYFKADGATALAQTFTYDADGNTKSFADTDVPAATVSYDNANRVSTVTAPAPYGTTTYTYFLDGTVSTVTDANGKTTFTEDLLGRVASMVTPLITGTTSYLHDAAGRLTRRTQANGIVTSATYTDLDRLASKTEVAGSTTLASWSNVTYDLARNRTAETLAYYSGNPYPDPQAGTSSYQYDSENQLSQATLPSATAATYGYDAAHNLTSNAGVSQGYRANESLQTVGTATIGADADGNQLADLSGNALSWNSLSQLESFGATETYTYDALGRLTTVNSGAGVTKFVYRGLTNQVVQELNSTNAVVRSYAWDDSRQLYAKSGGVTYYEITNPHGDVVALATASALAGTRHFDAWGNQLNSAGTSTPFGFQGAAGSWTNSSSGFVYMFARWYYPRVARFLSSDPAAGTASPRTPVERLRWLYVGNDPLVRDDPTGLVIEDVGGEYCDEACQAAGAALAAQAQADAQAAAAQAKAQQSCDWQCHLGNGWNALTGGVATIRPDWSQLTAENLGNAAAGWADSLVGSTIDLGCMGVPLNACDIVDPNHERDHLVSDGINAAGGHVDRNSDAYRDGQIAFTVGSLAAGAPGLIRSAPTLIKAGVSLAKAAPNLVREGAQLFRGTEDMESAAALTRQVGEGEGGAAQTSRVLGAAGDMGGAGPKALPPGGVNSWTGPILSRVTQSPETMYRVWGGGSSRVGQWLTPFKPVSAQTAREGLALPPGNTASFVSEVTVPTGTRIQVGTAGAAFGQPGGAAQVQLLDRIAPELFGEGQPLTPLLEASTI